MQKFLEVYKETLNNTQSINKNYVTLGFRSAGMVGGSPAAFKISLDRFYSKILLKVSIKQQSIDNKNNEIETKISSINQKIKSHKEQLNKLIKKDLADCDKEFQNVCEEIIQFKRNPQKFITTEKDNLLLWVYGVFGSAVFVFLYFFYSSVIYSALFRDINVTKYTIYNSIFYPRAIEEALNKGFAALMVVIFAPAIFIALGLIVENLKTKYESIFKFSWLILASVTFIIDALLAFHISERIYSTKAIDIFGQVKEFTLGDAIIDSNFWIIIALGFAVYLILGKMFSLFNDQRSNKNKFNQFEKSLLVKKQNARGKLDSINLRIRELENHIYQLNLSLTDIQKSPEKIKFNPIVVRKILSDYAIGWINYLQSGKYDEYYINDIKKELQAFYAEKGLNQHEKI